MADSTSEEDFEEEVLLLALLVRRRRQRRQARKRKVWARNWILRRNALGAYAGLICELDVTCSLWFPAAKIFEALYSQGGSLLVSDGEGGGTFLSVCGGQTKLLSDKASL